LPITSQFAVPGARGLCLSPQRPSPGAASLPHLPGASSSRVSHGPNRS